MKAALEKAIFNLIAEFEHTYGYIFKSIRCRKDDLDGLNGIIIISEENHDQASTEIHCQRLIATNFDDSVRISKTLESDILDSIQDFELEHNVIFKSLKCKKDKDGMLTGITVNFDGDDIPVIDIPTIKSPLLVKEYHLQKQEQKIPDGFQIYDERLEVAGIQHRRDVAAQFVNQTNQWLEFESEPLNRYDQNAIKILGCYHKNNETSKLHVGYVPAGIAKQITNFSAAECKARLLKTYISERGYVEILFQVLGPKGRIEEYASFYVPTGEDEDEDDD